MRAAADVDGRQCTMLPIRSRKFKTSWSVVAVSKERKINMTLSRPIWRLSALRRGAQSVLRRII
jgi:hypothetical protein